MKLGQRTISRRSFLAGSASTGLIMGLGTVLPGCSKEEAVSDMAATGGSKSFSPAVWFEVSNTGDVTVNIAKAEMGQHVGTALARIVADELGADWSQVSLHHVDSDPKWGYMVTGGSWSVVTSFTMLSQAGAAGRKVLIDAAAALLDVDASKLSAENGSVSGAGKSLSFAEIVSQGDVSRSFTEEELGEMPVKAPAERDLIGEPTDALDIPEKARGEAVYGLDTELPGMVYAHPLIAPTRYGSKVRSIDDSAAKDIPGYQQTIKIEDPTGFVEGMALVIADSFPAAMKASEAVKVEWDAGKTAGVSEADILKEGEKLVNDRSTGALFVNEGDTAAAMDGAAETMSSTYRTSTALHFTLEPQNALVEFKDGVCHVHAGNQWQSLIIPTLAKSLEMDESDIQLHTYYLGGGFGRRLFGDQMIPAAHAARQLGKPVKLIMQRPADSRFDCVRSPSVAKIDAAFDADGNQWQSLIIPTLAKSLEMDESDIQLHTYYLGGGFGRRLFGDQMIPAAHAARQLGKPVKLIMQRPADSRFDCVRSPSVAKIDAAFDTDGNLTAIDHAAAAGWPTKAMAPGFLGEAVDGNGQFDGFSINGADHWYSVPNHRVRAINNTLAQDTFLPGWLRAVGPGWISWSVESFIDEIAVKMGVDPVELRLSMLDAEGRNSGSAPMQVGGAKRLAAALEDVRDRSGWGKSLPEGEGMGVAVSHGQERAMPTWTACVAHVAVDGKKVKVRKIWQTLDCGTVVHPGGAMAQAEGATLWGVSLALHEGTAFENGHVKDTNLDTYKPLRMTDVPELDLKFMDSTEHPMGLGEPPLIAVAPAIGNAVFAATGQRVKDLPIRLG